MNIHRILGPRSLGMVTAVTLAAGMATAAAAGAATPAQPSASVANDTLTITGTNGGDAISLELAAGNPGTLLVDFGNGTLAQSFDRNTFSAIAVFLGGGDDQFNVSRVNGTFADEVLTVDGGRGNDTIFGGDGLETLSGGAGDDTITGGNGTDLIFGDGGNDVIDGGRGNDTEILGGGQDTALWNPGEGSDTIDGGAGKDTLVFNGSNAPETMSLSANGTNSVLRRDVAAIRMDMADVEEADVAALGGADTFTVGDLAGTDMRQANIDLSAQGAGDGQGDVVNVTGTNNNDAIDVSADAGAVDVTGLRANTHITGAETGDQLHVNALGGNDRVDVSDDARAVLGVVVDLGSGQR